MYPYLIYCVTIWGGSNVSTILPVVRTQKRALRCIFSVSKDTPSLPLFHELNVLQFSKVYELQMLLFVYKFKISALPKVFDSFFTRNIDVHSYRTRQILNYYPPRCKTDIGKNSVKYRGCILWNNLNSKTKSMSVSLSTFKCHIVKTCLST